jgi:hypothetical protein
LETTKKLTITAESGNRPAETEMLLAIKAVDLALCIQDIREKFVRLRNDGMTEADITFGDRGYEVVAASINDYGLFDMLEALT